VNLYHIATREAWAEAEHRGVYEAPSLKTEGFVHCSTAAQVLPAARRFFAGQTGLVLLVIDPTRLTSILKWEQVLDDPASVPGEQASAYPHIYGPINLDAVQEVLDLEPGPNGEFRAPAIVRREAETQEG
jgi:uncharacterized protein (DUF952 family)